MLRTTRTSKTRRSNRPNWAKRLPARLWKHLQEQQETKTPTLRQLREDVAHQQRLNAELDTHRWTCWECKEALKLAA